MKLIALDQRTKLIWFLLSFMFVGLVFLLTPKDTSASSVVKTGSCFGASCPGGSPPDSTQARLVISVLDAVTGAPILADSITVSGVTQDYCDDSVQPLRTSTVTNSAVAALNESCFHLFGLNVQEAGYDTLLAQLNADCSEIYGSNGGTVYFTVRLTRTVITPPPPPPPPPPVGPPPPPPSTCPAGCTAPTRSVTWSRPTAQFSATGVGGHTWSGTSTGTSVTSPTNEFAGGEPVGYTIRYSTSSGVTIRTGTTTAGGPCFCTSNGRITLSWNWDYDIIWCIAATGTSCFANPTVQSGNLDNQTGSPLNFTITNLAPNTRYAYQIEVDGISGDIEILNSSFISGPCACTSPPPPPPVGPPPPPPPSSAPDLTITGPLITASGISNPVTFETTVRNSGTASTGSGFQNRLTIDLDPRDGVFDITQTYASPTFIAGQTESPAHTWTWSPPVAGTHRVQICTDRPPDPNGVIAENNATGTGEFNNCTPPVNFTLSPDTSWMRTTGGAVGSQGDIQNFANSTTRRSADYLVIVNTGRTIQTGINTLKNWLVPSSGTSTYGLTLQGPSQYDDLKNKFAPTNAGTTSTGAFPTASGVYVYNNPSLTLNGVVGGCTYDPNDNNPDGIVIFVTGNLTLGSGQTELRPGCPVVIIGRQRIIVHEAMRRIDAFMISDSYFSSKNSAANPVNDLVINGGVISSTRAFGTAPEFSRQLTDNSQPAETINYGPEYLWLLRKFLGVSDSGTTETNP